MQSLHQSIIRILSSFWTYRLIEFKENIENLTCREIIAKQIDILKYIQCKLLDVVQFDNCKYVYSVVWRLFDVPKGTV
jgi:hypothetical protein